MEVVESSLRMLLAFNRSTRLDSMPASAAGLGHQMHPSPGSRVVKEAHACFRCCWLNKYCLGKHS